MSRIERAHLDAASLQDEFFDAMTKRDLERAATSATLLKNMGISTQQIREICSSEGIDVFDQDVTECGFVPDAIVCDAVLNAA